MKTKFKPQSTHMTLKVRNGTMATIQAIAKDRGWTKCETVERIARKFLDTNFMPINGLQR